VNCALAEACLSSRKSEFLDLFGKAVAQFKGDSAESEFVCGDVRVSFSAMEASRKVESVMRTALEFKI
jgi:hypothetical protein